MCRLGRDAIGLRPPTRADATRAALVAAAVEEFTSFGYRRSSMESVARRAGVSRATLYTHWSNKESLFRALTVLLHDQQVAAMERAATETSGSPLPERLRAVLEARFVRWVELTSGSPYAAELYDVHGRQCGDVARAAQERSELVLTRLLRRAARAGEIDLSRSGLSAGQAAEALFDAAHGAKGEDPSRATPAEFRSRLRRVVALAAAGLSPEGETR